MKAEIANLRKDYDVEIKTMFLELKNVKEELAMLKYENSPFMNGDNENGVEA